MAKVLLKRTEQFYADTLPEAKEVISEAQEDGGLVSQKITEKNNKYGTYHLVDLGFSYETPKGIMETQDGKKGDAPDGQMNMDEIHEGVPYTVSTDGSVKVEKTDEELPEFEDPFADVEVKNEVSSNEHGPF